MTKQLHLLHWSPERGYTRVPIALIDAHIVWCGDAVPFVPDELTVKFVETRRKKEPKGTRLTNYTSATCLECGSEQLVRAQRGKRRHATKYRCVRCGKWLK